MIPEGPFSVEERAPGAPTDPTFLLVHGYGASSFTWRRLAPELSARGRVLTADLVGYGNEPYPDELCAPATLAERLLAEVHRLDLRRLTLVGHSLGGGIVLRLAQRLMDEGRRPDRLVLIAGAAYEQPLPPFVALAHRGGPAETALRLLDPELLAAQVLRTIVYDPGTITSEMIAGYAAPLADASIRRALMAAARVIVPPDLERMTARYPELDMPALLVWGRQDRVVPLWVGSRLSQAMPGAELVVLERCGHVPMEEHPEALSGVVARFLDGPPAVSRSAARSPRST